MQMTIEQAMRPGILMSFATRRGSGYMMRSEKRGGSYGNGSGRPPRRKKAGFLYIFFTLLISVILWPVGMVMLWRRKVRMQAGTKLLISLLTLCLSVFLIVFALTVPIDNPQFTAFQDKANDWLDKAAVDVAAAGDAALKKSGETWHVMSDFAVAGADCALGYAADAVDKGVELAGQARASIEGLFHREEAEPEPAEQPEDTEAPADTEAPEGTEAPADTDAPKGDGGAAIDIRLPEEAPDSESAQALEEGELHADGSFEPGEVELPEPTERITEAPTEEPEEEPKGASESWAFVDAPTEEPAEEATEEPTEEPTKEPTEAPTEAPADEATEAPTEKPVEEATEAPAEEATEAPVEEATEAPTEAPTEVPTEAPTQEPTQAPAAYVVKPAADATVYFYDTSKGFHSAPTKHNMNGAPAHTLAEAFDAGKTPCASCGMPDASILEAENIAWVDEDNRIHTTDACASFSGQWRLMPLADAMANGYAACADCGADLYAEDIFPAPTPTPEPEKVSPSAALKPAGELTVYFYDASRGYHKSSSCVGMNNAPAHTLAEAEAAGKRACGNCDPAPLELLGLPTLWLDEAGVCHTTDACASFSGAATLIARDDALDQELPACPDCGAAEYLVPGTVLAD